MRRAFFIALASSTAALILLACAKAPEARPQASDVGAAPDASVDAISEATTTADTSFPGLPMPQKFPHVVWDAAGAPKR